MDHLSHPTREISIHIPDQNNFSYPCALNMRTGITVYVKPRYATYVIFVQHSLACAYCVRAYMGSAGAHVVSCVKIRFNFICTRATMWCINAHVVTYDKYVSDKHCRVFVCVFVRI